MAFLVSGYQPRTQIIARTWRGEEYDLTGSLFAWSRTKSLTQAPGTFTLQLVPRANAKGQTWNDLIKAQDIIEIRASKNGRLINGKLPIIMRGFVDAPSKNTQFAQSGGPSEPRITITGRDYTKLFLEWQILYLFTQNTLKKGGNLSDIAAQAAGFGLFANYRLPIFGASLNSYMTTAFDNIINPVQKGLKAHPYPDFPELTHRFTFPDYKVNSFNVASYTGSYWNLFQYIASPPFGELFIIDEEDSPVLVGRATAYQDITGGTPSPGTKLASSGDILGVQSDDTDTTDADLSTYFLTWAADAQIIGPSTMPVVLPGLHNGVLTSKSSLYGIKPLNIDTPWLSMTDKNIVTAASDLNLWLVETMGDNERWYQGTLTCHGDEDYTIGTYRREPVSNRQYYISSIQDSYNYEGNRWDATLTVVRGRDLGVST